MAKNYQIQPTIIGIDGSEVNLYFVNTAADVRVGKLEVGKLALPGSSNDEILSQTLSNIAKWLDNLTSVAAEKREVIDVDGLALSADTDIPSMEAFRSVQSEISLIGGKVDALNTDLSGYAPKVHTSEASSTYGAATTAVFGHVKLSDTIVRVLDGDALALSQKAGATLKTLIDARAPENHAYLTSLYGAATSDLFGHVKISDVYETELTADSDRSAFSQKGAYTMYSALKSNINALGAGVEACAPTNHADSSTRYGGGNSTLFGHVKITDDANDTSVAASSIAVSPYALYTAKNVLSQSFTVALDSHNGIHGNSTTFGHVKLSDAFTSSAGTAADGVGASSYAVKLLYNNVMSTLGGYLPLAGGTMTGTLKVGRIVGTENGGYPGFYVGNGTALISSASNGMGLIATNGDISINLTLYAFNTYAAFYPESNGDVQLGIPGKCWGTFWGSQIYGTNVNADSVSTKLITMQSGAELSIADRLKFVKLVSTSDGVEYNGISIEPKDDNYIWAKANILYLTAACGWDGSLIADGRVRCNGNLSVGGISYLNSGNCVYFKNLICFRSSEDNWYTPFIGEYIRLKAQYANLFDLISASSGTIHEGLGLNFSFYDDFCVLRPTNTDAAYLGYNADGQRWKAIYAINGTIQTSDRKKKKSIESLSQSRMIEFIQNLDPVSYQFKDGTSGRTHYGLIAQDVENVLSRMGLTSLDFAGLCKDYPTHQVADGDSAKLVVDATKEPDYALRYDEFIAPMISVEQSLLNEVALLKNENQELKERLAAIERSLGIS